MAVNPIFHSLVSRICAEDDRYHADAFFFVAQSISGILSNIRRTEHLRRHISAQEIIEGLASCAVAEYGPLASIVLKDWGIQSNADIGNIIYHLIRVKIFEEGPNDNISDFSRVANLFEILNAKV